MNHRVAPSRYLSNTATKMRSVFRSPTALTRRLMLFCAHFRVASASGKWRWEEQGTLWNSRRPITSHGTLLPFTCHLPLALATRLRLRRAAALTPAMTYSWQHLSRDSRTGSLTLRVEPLGGTRGGTPSFFP